MLGPTRTDYDDPKVIKKLAERFDKVYQEILENPLPRGEFPNQMKQKEKAKKHGA